MTVSNPQKTIYPEKLSPGETARLRISFRAAGDHGCPTDLILAMDCSGSMGGSPLEKTVEAARAMVRNLYCGCCCRDCGCRGPAMGLIRFSDCAVTEVPLQPDPEKICRALECLKAGGNTNHEKAFILAGEMFRKRPEGRKILILFTDGDSNAGCPGPAARALREEGIEIFCIGLGVNREILADWASCPLETHVAVTGDLCRLTRIFEEIGCAVSASGVQNIRILERVAQGFRIVKFYPPSKGEAALLDDRTLRWTIASAGEQGEEELYLCLDVQYTGCCMGTIQVNECLNYEDCQHHCLVFPNPWVTICPGWNIPGDPCTDPCCIVAEPCRDAAIGCPCNTILSGLGRIVEAKAIIRNVCPGRSVAVAVILTELDPEGCEHDRGMKVYEIRPQAGETCRDVVLNCVQFVVPESVRTWGNPESLCEKRRFLVRVLANYLDTDYTCCQGCSGEGL